MGNNSSSFFKTFILIGKLRFCIRSFGLYNQQIRSEFTSFLSSQGEVQYEIILSEQFPKINLPVDEFPEIGVKVNLRQGKAWLVPLPELTVPFQLGRLIRIFMIHHIVENQGLVFHSSTIVYQQKAYLFIGPSGSGKTTLAKKALGKYPVLGDETGLVAYVNGSYQAYFAPFDNVCSPKNTTLSYSYFPLEKVCLLKKGDSLTIQETENIETIVPILQLPMEKFKTSDFGNSNLWIKNLEKFIKNYKVNIITVSLSNSVQEIMDRLN